MKSSTPSTSTVWPAGPETGTTGPGRHPPKGQQTHAALLDVALALALQQGLEGLSIGGVAERAAMSKSGVFAHFGSREELQISVIREYHRRFELDVFTPALAEPRGLPRLRALFERWLHRVAEELGSGCLYIGGAVEFDDRAGPVRDQLMASVQSWHRALGRAIGQAVDAGHLRADTDVQQLLFEMHGLILALHHDVRFLRLPLAPDRARAGFARLLQQHQAPGKPLQTRPRRRPASAHALN